MANPSSSSADEIRTCVWYEYCNDQDLPVPKTCERVFIPVRANQKSCNGICRCKWDNLGRKERGGWDAVPA